MAEDHTSARARLVRRLRRSGVITSEEVAAAMASVPRERFLGTDDRIEQAYADTALVLTSDPSGRPTSSISQPSMVALMLEQLDVHPGHQVLEVGTASGYNAALLAALSRPGGSVVSLEIDGELASVAASRLAELAPEVRVLAGDGWAGATGAAPFDRVEVTVGVDDLSEHWVGQLVPDGILVAPVQLRPGVELSVAFTRTGDQLCGHSSRPCGFVRMRGPHGSMQRDCTVGDQAVSADWLDEANRPLLARLLAQRPHDGGPAPAATDGWYPRLALDHPRPVVLSGYPDGCYGVFDPEPGGLAAVAEGRLIGYGDTAVLGWLRGWLSTARPLHRGDLQVRAVPSGLPADPPGTWVLSRAQFDFHLDEAERR